MGGLLSGLNVGYSGIVAARAGVQLTSQNINNANTDGYNRRTLEQSSRLGPPIFGGGVSVDGVLRVEDRLLGTQVETSAGREGHAHAREGLLTQVEGMIGDLGEQGIGSAISHLFSSFSQLSTAPADSAVREQVLSAAGRVANVFNHASSQLAALASGIDSAVEGGIAQVNGQLAEVARLNGRILQTEAAGGNASELRDRQGVLLDDLASTIGVKSFLADDGQTTVLLGGMSLVQDDVAATLSTAPDTALGGHLRVDLVSAGTRVDMTARLGGAMGGRIAVRDETVPAAQGRLDNLAYDLATALNTAHAAGFGLDGSTGNNLFTVPASASGAAGQIAVNASLTSDQLAASATAGGIPGDAANALVLAQLGDSALAAGGTRTAADEAGVIVGWIGGETDSATAEAEASADELNHLETLSESEEGVSVDEEMVHLIMYQRSFQAATRVLHVFDSLLEEIVRLK